MRLNLLTIFFSCFLFNSLVCWAEDSDLSCNGLLQESNNELISSEESFFIPIDEYAENIRHHIKRILYATYVETFPVNFTRVTERIDRFILKVNEIPKVDYVDGSFIRTAFGHQKSMLLENIPYLEAEYSDPIRRNLNLDYWYAKFTDALEAKVISERGSVPEDFVGSESEWIALLDSLFVPKAKFLPYAKKSLKRRIKSKISDITDMLPINKEGSFQSLF